MAPVEKTQIVEALQLGARGIVLKDTGTSVKTQCKHHLANIFDKLGVSTRSELALFAGNHKLPLKTIHTKPEKRLEKKGPRSATSISKAPSIHSKLVHAIFGLNQTKSAPSRAQTAEKPWAGRKATTGAESR